MLCVFLGRRGGVWMPPALAALRIGGFVGIGGRGVGKGTWIVCCCCFFFGEQMMGNEGFFVALGGSGIFSGGWIWRFID